MTYFQLTHLAASDLEDIFDQIAADNETAAKRLIATLEVRCKSLASMPNQGRQREELFPGLRSVAVGNYIIFYKPTSYGVVIIRVLHAKRDSEKFFSDEDRPTELNSH